VADKEINTKPNAIILNKNDNIIIALRNMNAGDYLKDFGLKIDAPILSGQKIAKVDISKDAPIYKYGTIIGFADSDIKKGQVLINSNVVFKEFNREHEYCSKYKPTKFANT
jgi:altronate hydrolase